MNSTFTGIFQQHTDISTLILQSVVILMQFISGIAVILVKRALNKNQLATNELQKDLTTIGNKVEVLTNSAQSTPRSHVNEPINLIDDKVLDDLKQFWRSKGFDLEYNLTPR